MKYEGCKCILSFLAYFSLISLYCVTKWEKLLLSKNTIAASVYSSRYGSPWTLWMENTWSQTSTPGASKQRASPMHVVIKCLLHSLTESKSASASFDSVEVLTLWLPHDWPLACDHAFLQLSFPGWTESPDPLGEWLGSVTHNSVTRICPSRNTELQKIWIKCKTDRNTVVMTHYKD